MVSSIRLRRGRLFWDSVYPPRSTRWARITNPCREKNITYIVLTIGSIMLLLLRSDVYWLKTLIRRVGWSCFAISGGNTVGGRPMHFNLRVQKVEDVRGTVSAIHSRYIDSSALHNQYTLMMAAWSARTTSVAVDELRDSRTLSK